MRELRYERKYFVAEKSLAEIITRVKMHPTAFAEVYPTRLVNNIYFDTTDFSYWRRHVNGSSRRNKIRIRWYGRGQKRISCPMLEIKRRVGVAGDKIRYALVPFKLDRRMAGLDWRRIFSQSGLPGALEEMLQRLGPVLINQYERSYWLSGDRRWRLTIDSDIRFSRWTGGRRAGGLVTPDVCVIELKYNVSDGGNSGEVGQYFPWRIAQYSKYVFGVRTLYL
ncbi:MAG: polyphosphate polymerase domain-containing protein [bacterium]